jgi:hypothetical protein
MNECEPWKSFTVTSIIYGHVGKPALQFLGTLAACAASSVSAGSDDTPSLFMKEALRALCSFG